MAYEKLSYTVYDFSHEASSIQIGWDDGILVDDVNTLTTNLQALSLGTFRKRQHSRVVQLNSGYPASQLAQREVKFLVQARDNVTGKAVSFTIPAANVSAVTIQAGTDLVDLTVAPVSALVTSINGNARSDANNPITVEAIRLVGRNI